jgi:hypothetical protein
LPFNKSGGVVVLALEQRQARSAYIAYDTFDGARTNFDGQGRNAPDNNTLFLEAWLAF